MDDKLSKFATLVEMGSFTRAADALHISQPALSVAIQKLEKSCKVKLLSSAGRRGIELTEAGKTIYAAALEHRMIDQSLKSRLSALGGDKSPLRIGMIDSVAAWLCAQKEPLATLEIASELSLHVENSEQLSTAVRRGNLDIAVVVKGSRPVAQLQEVAEATERLVFVCEASRAEEMQKNIQKRMQLPFVSYLPTSNTYQTIFAELERSRIAVQPILYSTSPDVMQSMVLQGRGAAVLPESLVADNLANGSLALLSLPTRPYYISRQLSVVIHRDTKLSSEMSQLIDALKTQFV